jgi:hypothetical protein
MIRPTVPILAKCKTDKSEHHQDGACYHQPVGILQVGEDAQGRLTFSLSAPRVLFRPKFKVLDEEIDRYAIR